MQLLRSLSIISVILLCLSCEGPRHVTKPVLIEQEVTDSSAEVFLQDMVKEEHFTGVALIMRKKEVIHAKGYGWANCEKKNSVTTPFHIASITKQFTAAAILQLVEQGKVSLDGSVNEFLPVEYRSHKWNSVTIHHLLNHTSGIPDYAVTRDYYEVVKGFCLGNTVHGMVKEAMAKDLEFKPGSNFSYSNIGYTLLGFVIENQTKTPYDKYLKVNILDPMGMSSSKIHVIGHVSTPEEAEGYRWSKEQSVHVPDDVVSLPVTAPDGGLVTTLSDFVKWIGIYMGMEQTILDRKSIDRMTSPLFSVNLIGPRGKPQSYGYGLLVEDEVVSHSGYIVGFRSHFIVDRQKKILIAVFSNNTTNNPERISTGLLKVLEKSDF